MKVIGLAGRPGSGKSAVASGLAKRSGVEWVDLDRLAWEVYAPGTPGFARIVAAFGEGIVGRDGRIDRVELGRIVFRDPRARDKLERIVHPTLNERLSHLMKEHEEQGTEILIVEGALIASSPYVDRSAYDVVIWLEAPEDIRRERLAAVGRGEQASRGRVIAPSDGAIVIDATGPIEEVAARVWEAIAKV